MTRGVRREDRSPLSEEIKAELSRIRPSACDARVLAELLPRAGHLGAPARRLAHSTETATKPSMRRTCCQRTYLRALFLSGGSLSAGRSGYLLEVRPPSGESLRARRALIGAGLQPKTRSRRGRKVHTLRDANSIAAFLRLAGASETLLRFESRRVSREMRGQTNAWVNAEAANLSRAVLAARRQSLAIQALTTSGRLAAMPALVRAAAAARVRAPEATLAELADRLDTTKWAVRQRLRRILEEAVR